VQPGGFTLPLLKLAGEDPAPLPGWPGLTLARLRARRSVETPARRLYLVLEGELLIDLASGSYLHLRRGDAAQVEEAHTLVPVAQAVVLEWKPSS